MKITFKQVNDQHIDIMSGDKKVGHIFSPGGTGEHVTNAIQVCGFEDAYDLWGCGLFSEKFEEKKDRDPRQIEYLKNKGIVPDKDYVIHSRNVHKKDIQLLFKDYDNQGFSNGMYCPGCYNEPCTCDSKKRGFPISLKSSFNAKFKKRMEDISITKESVDNHGLEKSAKIQPEGAPEEIKFVAPKKEKK